MRHLQSSMFALVGTLGLSVTALAGWAHAQDQLPTQIPDQIPSGPAEAPPPPQPEQPPQAAPAPPPAAEAAPPPSQQQQQDIPIPPSVQGQAIPVAGGGYCFGGPHPAPGGGWEAVQTPHVHNYAPFDLRLFSYHNGCYYFIGDPRDFGYTGQVYSYYGAHPIADAYGGGWCFMVGPHTHWWRPWSSYFTVVGPWYYWNGPYDPYFWAYWPFYSFYYRSYYPNYYAGGRFFRGGYRVAPAISRVPASAAAWRTTGGGAAAVGSNGWRTTPGAVAPGHAAAVGRGPAAAAGRVGASPAYQGGWRGGSVPYSGGSHFGGGGFRGGGGGHVHGGHR